MRIKNVEGMSKEELYMELDNKGKFVVFEYCFSIIVMTFRRKSDVYFIKAGESTAKHSLIYSVITLLFGWWGIPWGPVFSIGALFTNMGGGKIVTHLVIDAVDAQYRNQK